MASLAAIPAQSAEPLAASGAAAQPVSATAPPTYALSWVRAEGAEAAVLGLS